MTVIQDGSIETLEPSKSGVTIGIVAEYSRTTDCGV